jgi:hypothetical protein
MLKSVATVMHGCRRQVPQAGPRRCACEAPSACLHQMCSPTASAVRSGCAVGALARCDTAWQAVCRRLCVCKGQRGEAFASGGAQRYRHSAAAACSTAHLLPSTVSVFSVQCWLAAGSAAARLVCMWRPRCMCAAWGQCRARSCRLGTGVAVLVGAARQALSSSLQTCG